MDLSNKKLRKRIYDKYNGRCAYCGIDLKKRFTINHIEPKFRGSNDEELKRNFRIRGKSEMSNYNPCCNSCNSSKSTMSLEKWRSEINKKYNRLIRDSSSFNLLVRFGMIKRTGNCIFYFEKYIAGILYNIEGYGRKER